MVENLILRSQPLAALPVEIVERKGIGHSDTICDALAENLSRNLCRLYLEQTGTVLHHNVDKALLHGGTAYAVFGGGEVIEPIDIYLAGRATTRIDNLDIPVGELAVEGSRAWLKEHLHALDAENHVRIHCLLRPGSTDLSELFRRGIADETPLANDTSFGVGYAPASALEKAVLEAGHALDRNSGEPSRPARGEDTKIMAVLRNSDLDITVACAMISPQISNAQAYQEECRKVIVDLKAVFERHGFTNPGITVNAADDPAHDTYYLTVTGTSAEAGDDGQVGRGNRANGLITPFRPMSLEAVCGKNPVNHVGKLYNIAAREIAQKLVDNCQSIAAAQCCLVSQIGHPITEPAIVDIAISTIDASPASQYHKDVQEITSNVLSSIPSMLNRFIYGEEQLY